ncbi:MAG: hypothetical protein V2J65_25130, partial [Desulfobacteraceae bacterium]|nr:hypothetical protein [Desulfobacteraceae bacterium]
MNVHLKGDERILGDTGFVTSVLSRASEQMDERYQLRAAGWTLHGVIEQAGRIFGVDIDQIRSAGKQPKCVKRRKRRDVHCFISWLHPLIDYTNSGRNRMAYDHMNKKWGDVNLSMC